MAMGGENGSITRSGQPAPVLVAWLSEIVDEARKTPIPHLQQLRQRLQSGEFRWECIAFGSAMSAWAEAANQVALSALRKPGLWSRLTGAHAREMRRFTNAVSQAVRAGAKVADELLQFEAACRSQQAARKLLVELDFERKALAEEIEPATGWLAEVADALGKTTSAHAANRTWAAAAERARSLPQEIKQLHELIDAAHAVSTLGLKILAGRAAALAGARALLDEFNGPWTLRVAALAGRAPGRGSADGSSTPATRVHDEFVQKIDHLTHAVHELDIDAEELDRLLWEMAEAAV